MSGFIRNLRTREAHALLGGSWGSLKLLYISALLIAWPAAFDGLLISIT